MSSVLQISKAPVFLPYIFGPLSKCSQGHWNQTVEGLSQSVLRMYMDSDLSLYDKCSRENGDKQKQDELEREKASDKWTVLQAQAKEQGLTVAKVTIE